MRVSYDVFTNAFLSKVTEYDFFNMTDFERTSVVDHYMKTAISSFNRLCKYDFIATADDILREFHVEIEPQELQEIVRIVSEGMLVEWMKPYVYRQENLQNVLNTRDFTTYSPAELLLRITNAYQSAQKDFSNMIKQYSYDHGDLTNLHL